MLANATYRKWEMSRDAYMDIGGRATQDAKAEDRKSVATSIQYPFRHSQLDWESSRSPSIDTFD